MAPSDSRTRQLLTILAKENSKTGQFQRTPAQFRETALDTHKTTPAHDFGPSPDLLPAGFRGAPDYLTMLKSQSARRATRRSLSATRGGSGSGMPPEQIEYRSVFKPRPDQEHVCNLAKTHRQNVFNSEYALIDTLGVHLHNLDREQRERLRAKHAAEQKAYLDSQVREKQQLEQKELDIRARDEQLAKRELDAAVEAEQRKIEAMRAKNVTLRVQMKDQLQTARQAKHAAQLAKQQEEAKLLADIQAQLEHEKALAAAKNEAVRQQSLVTKADNEARIRAKKEADAMQRQLDTELMQAGIRLAERQEKEREDAGKAFKAMIESRARGAGQKKVDDDRERAEREAWLMKQFEEQKEREAQLREQQEREKKERQKQELQQARKDFLSLKEQRAAAARGEMQALRDEAEMRSRAEREAEERKLMETKTRAKNHGDFLATQITARELASVDDMVGMSERERQMNHRLLKQAVKVVGPHPAQLTAKW